MKSILYVLIISGLFLSVSTSCAALDCQLTLSKDVAYADKWYKTPGHVLPTLSTAKEVCHQEYFSVLLFFSGYKTDLNNCCNISYEIKIVNTAGKVCFSQKNLPALSCKVINPNFTMLNSSPLRVCFDLTYPQGEYQVVIDVLDHVSGQTTASSGKISLTAYRCKALFSSDDALIGWINTYYQNPTPEKAIDAYLYYAGSKLAANDQQFFPVFAFFLQVFNDNEFLFPHLIALYNQQDFVQKTFILYLLRYSRFTAQNLINRLQGEELALYQKISVETLPDPYAEIAGTPQLDMLWGSFWASGKYQPILALVKSLELCRYNGVTAPPGPSGQRLDDQEKAGLSATYQSALWSLTNNCAQHPLIRDYCQYIYRYEELSAEVRSQLAKILGAKYTPNLKNRTMSDLRQPEPD